MDVAALITWLITAGGGFILLGTWIAKGGHRTDTRPSSHLTPGQVFGHFLLAAGGLVLWIVYVASDSRGVGWVALADIVVVALLGFSMFFRWLPQVRARQPVAAAVGGRTSGDGAGEATPEQRFPLPVVVLHGLLGATTLLLVLIAATRS